MLSTRAHTHTHTHTHTREVNVTGTLSVNAHTYRDARAENAALYSASVTHRVLSRALTRTSTQNCQNDHFWLVTVLNKLKCLD